jgi:hypothetical protein
MSTSGGFIEKRLAMVSRCIRLAVGSLVLCFASSAGAQERGKTLYASLCERCHKSPQDVTTFHGGVDLETFLAELHYADTPESAATIAAYLKGLERKPVAAPRPPAKRPTHRRKTEHRGKANPSQAAPSQPVPTNADSSEIDPVRRTLKRLCVGPQAEWPLCRRYFP